MLLTANIFQPLIDVFGSILTFFHNSLGIPWGWSIVVLTVAVRALLIPLAFKQFHSMQKLQQVAPQLKAIQNKYKEDKQRQQQEVMKFYKENEINPFASCLPLVAQLPVFIGLFYTLRTTLRKDICPQLQPGAFLRGGHWVVPSVAHTKACGAGHGAGFLFISDMTNKATGITLVALIVLYVGTQLVSSLMMATPTMERSQRMIMLFMPLFFVVIIINFPSGLIVYWITTNTWTILQQYLIRRSIGPMGPPVVALAGAGAGGGGPAPLADSGEGGGTGPNGAGALGGLLRGRMKPAEKEPAGVSARRERRGEAPPPPPRKKKKRSGRRR